MSADVIYLHRPPLARLSTRARVMIIESLAHDEHVTAADKASALRRICHPSLHGLRLWFAWLAAEDAILVRDWTPTDDADHEGLKVQADIAIAALVHGTHGSAA